MVPILFASIPSDLEITHAGKALQDYRMTFTSKPPSRYFIWQYAEELFRFNPQLFGNILDIMDPYRQFPASSLPLSEASQVSGKFAQSVAHRFFLLFEGTAEMELSCLSTSGPYIIVQI
jgi:hypothetical protein